MARFETPTSAASAASSPPVDIEAPPPSYHSRRSSTLSSNSPDNAEDQSTHNLHSQRRTGSLSRCPRSFDELLKNKTFETHNSAFLGEKCVLTRFLAIPPGPGDEPLPISSATFDYRSLFCCSSALLSWRRLAVSILHPFRYSTPLLVRPT